jgi:nitrite reductase/ring-hydroxylating ferredoxin subunit
MYRTVCKVSDLSEGELTKYEVDGKWILVLRLGNSFFATDSTCTHEESDLSLGMVSDKVLSCPLHQAKFDLNTGKVLSGPEGSDTVSVPNLKIYQTRVEAGNLLVET